MCVQQLVVLALDRVQLLLSLDCAGGRHPLLSLLLLIILCTSYRGYCVISIPCYQCLILLTTNIGMKII